MTDFLVLSRATAQAATSDDDAGLTERHWSYMDGYADRLTARGPLLGPDRETWAGSVHVVGLPDAAAARAFVEQEPYQGAGAYADHSIWRFTNLLGRTMWDFPGAADEPRFFLVGLAGPTAPQPAAPTPSDALQERLIVHGQLHDADLDTPVGVALAVQAAGRRELDALLADQLAGYDEIEVHDWEFGGRR
ncbi:YciI family protein [Luteipulveratus flavus]|uniref:YciI family protein n=1 Tax=Luteipulveratus flavus TaxID=3031728 RepID=A0ABT6C1B7_9MICO|nr:YciI family protein [Luteipulveratus sp. YIM 133296]MDF8262638.1 YciI family protein [Luteipulveratus sp. YIM 133296]